jgi:hypothetical protein
MKIGDAFPSKFLKASDLQDRPVTVTMEHVGLEDVGDSDRKPVLYFKGRSKGLVLNKTNSRTIAGAYGDDTDAWQGKPLTLFPAMVDFRGDTVEAIRVRVPPASRSTAPRPRPERDDPRTSFHESENPGEGLDDEVSF